MKIKRYVKEYVNDTVRSLPDDYKEPYMDYANHIIYVHKLGLITPEEMFKMIVNMDLESAMERYKEVRNDY